MDNETRAAEQSVLGSILRDNAVLADVLQIVRQEDFNWADHQMIFAASTDLWSNGKPIDLVTLADALALRQQIEDIGGYVYLAVLFDAAPTTAFAEYYARIVRERSVYRALAHAAAKIAHEATHPTGSAEQAVEMAEREVFAIADVGVQGAAVPLEVGVHECLDRLDARAEHRATAGAVATGFLDLDELTCGLQASELAILAARPSTGKTALALALARNAALAGISVFFASLEQPLVDLAERLLCCESRVDGYRIRKGHLDGNDRSRIAEARIRLSKLPLFIDDTSSQTVLRIAANVRRLRHRHSIGLAVVDYLQLIDPDDRKASRQEQVASDSRRLKHLAREAQIPVLCLAQLNREVEHRASGRPKLADLRDSGEIEQNADTVILLHRPENTEGVVEVEVAKQRNGPVGVLTLTFLKQYMRFEDFAVASPFSNGFRNGYHAPALS